MKHILKLAAYTFGFLVLLAGAYIYSAVNQRRKFIEESVGILSMVNAAEDVAKLEPEFHPEFIWVRKFKDGSWAAARALDEEETDYGFTAALIYTGGGKFWLSSHGFCGFEGVEGELGAIKAESAAEFVAGAEAGLGFERYR
ncbi:MAG: hypothetical protein A2081_05195 [Elusimicrobia bacterium GWC2_61_19]|nr:MAG: hypothetical protein A2081_05195 [Elusimicrobia bacterium GWC2_61_19]